MHLTVCNEVWYGDQDDHITYGTTDWNAFADQQTPCQHLQAPKYSEWKSVAPEPKDVGVCSRTSNCSAYTRKRERFVSCTAHIIEHLLPPLDVPAPLTERATLAASVNASLTPRFRFAEHSTSAKAVSSFPETVNRRERHCQSGTYPNTAAPVSSLRPLTLVCNRS